ncbi:MAG TPA: ribonuclease Z [Bellilinea sp.]|nr:ribonuclease Z [Bellilinea sp.]
MFELVFLGTSASAPSVRRNLPALVVKHDEHRFLVDCGEGTQRQILQSGIGFKRLNRILITHGHLDHILGLAGLLSTFMRWESIDELEVIGGKAGLDRVAELLYGVVLRGQEPPLPLTLRSIEAGTVITEADFTISAFNVSHRGPDNFGYLFEEIGRRPFIPDKAEALGIPIGPLRRDLVNGNSVQLPDGRTIEPDSVLGEFRPGTRLAVVGDTGDTANLLKTVSGVDTLVMEATYLEEETAMARQFGHMTARRSAELARDAGIGQLVLTHVSRRYREKDIQAEAQAVFENTVVARDFDVFQVKRADA